MKVCSCFSKPTNLSSRSVDLASRSVNFRSASAECCEAPTLLGTSACGRLNWGMFQPVLGIFDQQMVDSSDIWVGFGELGIGFERD